MCAVQSFVQKERLGSAEAWYCPKCKEHVQATKKLDLWSAPEVLILHLKRFQYTTQSRRKIDAPVAFPLKGLDLSPYLIHQQVLVADCIWCVRMCECYRVCCWLGRQAASDWYHDLCGTTAGRLHKALLGFVVALVLQLGTQTVHSCDTRQPHPLDVRACSGAGGATGV